MAEKTQTYFMLLRLQRCREGVKGNAWCGL